MMFDYSSRLICSNRYGNVCPFHALVSSLMEPAFDKSTNTGFRHFTNAAQFSWQGLRNCFANEAAFRQELAVLVLLTPLGIWISSSIFEFALLLGFSLVVLVAELLNSAIEAAVDRVSLEHHELAGRAKDYGSAAVAVALLGAGLVWLSLLLTKLGITNVF